MFKTSGTASVYSSEPGAWKIALLHMNMKFVLGIRGIFFFFFFCFCLSIIDQIIIHQLYTYRQVSMNNNTGVPRILRITTMPLRNTYFFRFIFIESFQLGKFKIFNRQKQGNFKIYTCIISFWYDSNSIKPISIRHFCPIFHTFLTENINTYTNLLYISEIFWNQN